MRRGCGRVRRTNLLANAVKYTPADGAIRIGLRALHGGGVAASSGGEGHGSRFIVRLPQIPSPPLAHGPRWQPGERPTARRVLLIEDDTAAREMLRMALELDGHEVHAAADGGRGLDLLKAARPDVGIIDLGLPVLDGCRIARLIREQPQGRGMMLIALTGSDTPGDRARTAAHGFDHHLVKPADPDRLSHLLRQTAT